MSLDTHHSSPVRKVRLLPQEVIHRIAAGEVVDRPASVLKELLDNSIDAGASHIRVLLIDGGLKSLEVEDNGSGMSRDDLEVCTLRHATSKIESVDDLDAIQSLGFRGEALAAISSVSSLKIESVQKGGKAWLLESKGGIRPELRPASRHQGSRVVVDDLFFNVPARKKFLKSLGSELNECLETLTSVALAHPEISFEWHALDAQSGEIKKTKTLIAGTLRDRFEAIYAQQADMLHFEQLPSLPEIKKVEIAIYRPPMSSNFQKTVRLSVNGRPVIDKRLPYSLREAFGGLIEVGRYPIFQANLMVDVHSVDVNIHPQKKEIRWPHNFSLASFLYSLVRPQFEIRSAPTVSAEQAVFFAGDSAEISRPIENPSPMLSIMPDGVGGTADSDAFAEMKSPAIANFNPAQSESRDFLRGEAPRKKALISLPESQPRFRFSHLRVIGEAGAAWILCESESGVVLIDQHAAHERVNYERILNHKTLLRSKPLLFPLDLPESAEWEGLLSPLATALKELAFELSDDEKSIIAVPEADRKIDWSKWIQDILEELRSSEEKVGRLQKIRTEIAASLSCHGSVRRGQRLSHDEIHALLQSLDEVAWGGLCPHGRPVWFELSHEKIEESFHR